MSIRDELLDVDSHEMTPPHMAGEVFGQSSGDIAAIVEPLLRQTAGAGREWFNPSLKGDFTEITHKNVWNIKGSGAPGAFDFARRIDVMNEMGIEKQLVFPSFAMLALSLMSAQSEIRNFLRVRTDLAMTDDELATLGRAGLDEYNTWAARTTAIYPNRLRPVGYISPCDTVEELIDETRKLVDGGLRVVHMAHGVPPGGRSPAHPDLDQFWQLLTDADVVCTTHLVGEGNFMRSSEWVNAPAFAPGKVQSHEVGLEPYSFATLHLPISNFLSCMVLGGVFERHPRLRFGVIELGSSWLGPLAETLDMWARDMYAERLKPFISELPSCYLSRNVRVTPFNVVEPVAKYLKQYPHLADCYCYSTDYPHLEGGKEDVIMRQFDNVSELGDEMARKFFIDNGRLLLPDLQDRAASSVTA